MPDPQAPGPTAYPPTTFTGPDGRAYTFTPANESDTASEGGIMQQVGHALYGALPEIAGGLAGAGVGATDLFDAGASTPFIAPAVGATTAAVQRLLEGERDPVAIGKSAGIHGALSGLPEVAALPGVSGLTGRIASTAKGLVSPLSKLTRLFPGGTEFLDALTGSLPAGADTAAEIASRGGYANAPESLQLQALKEKLVDPRFANNVQARAAITTAIRTLQQRMSSATALSGARMGVPLAETFRNMFYPNDNRP